jgi:ubiquinone/menaquinone biosynthesis C-methylase UbiE
VNAPNKKSPLRWKKKDREFHEDPVIVERYDDYITRKYRLEHECFTMDVWADELKKEGKAPVLDYGCGTGTATMKLLRRGIRTVSMDASLTMVRLLKKKAVAEGAECLCVVGDAEHLPFKDDVFNGLICAGVLHHIPSIEKGVAEQARVLKKEGMLFVAEPFNNKPWFSYPYCLTIRFCRLIWELLKRSRLKTQERLLGKKDLDALSSMLTRSGFDLDISYFAYWPVVCGYFPRFISRHLILFLNRINAGTQKGDSFIVRARKIK